MLKRVGYTGTFRHFSPKCMNRYTDGSAGRHNVREINTAEPVGIIARDMVGKRLRYRNLVG